MGHDAWLPHKEILLILLEAGSPLGLIYIFPLLK
jgi:hypothetical protein